MLSLAISSLGKQVGGKSFEPSASPWIPSAAQGGQGCRPGVTARVNTREPVEDGAVGLGGHGGQAEAGRPRRSASFEVKSAERCVSGRWNGGRERVADCVDFTHTRTHIHLGANDRRSGGIERCDGLVRECLTLSSAANRAPATPTLPRHSEGTAHHTRLTPEILSYRYSVSA